jgi:hypothetical protein
MKAAASRCHVIAAAQQMKLHADIKAQYLRYFKVAFI